MPESNTRDVLIAHLQTTLEALVQVARMTREETVRRALTVAIQEINAALLELGVVRTSEPPPIGREPPPPGGGDPVPPVSGDPGGGSDPIPPSDPGTGTGSGTPPPGAWVKPGDVGAHDPFTRQVYGATGSSVPKKDLYVLDDATVRSGPINHNAVLMSFEGDMSKTKTIDWGNVDVRAVLGYHRKWAARLHDVFGAVLRNCTIADIDGEHGLYWTTIGGFLLERCHLYNLIGQAVQIVGARPGGKRQGDTGLTRKIVDAAGNVTYDSSAWQTWVNAHQNDWQQVIECVIEQVGLAGSDRRGFGLSFFGDVPFPVRVARSWLKTVTSYTTGTGTYDCAGAIMAHGRKEVEILDNYVEFNTPDRSVMQFWQCGKVLIRGNMVISGQEVEIRLGLGGVAVIQGNVGSTCDVIISTNKGGIQMNQAEWDPSLILHKGKLRDDITVTVP